MDDQRDDHEEQDRQHHEPERLRDSFRHMLFVGVVFAIVMGLIVQANLSPLWVIPTTAALYLGMSGATWESVKATQRKRWRHLRPKR